MITGFSIYKSVSHVSVLNVYFVISILVSRKKYNDRIVLLYWINIMQKQSDWSRIYTILKRIWMLVMYMQDVDKIRFYLSSF